MQDRKVQQISPAPQEREEQEPLPFSSFGEKINIVLLGDPGAGKTYLFQEAAEAGGGCYLTARSFLNIPSFPAGSVLFIDGLDERRGGRGDRGTIDAIVQKLFAAAPAKVRISCRVADWLGESDLAAFQTYFDYSGEAVVLGLARLSRDEQQAVLTTRRMTAGEADEFLKEANARGVAEFLENPRNLIMLVDVVRAGSWPSTRSELFRLSARVLLSEPNREHARTGAGAYSVEELQRDWRRDLCCTAHQRHRWH